jgi:hypothetical protein
MAWYVYKCSSKNSVGPFFDNAANSNDGTASWGSDEFVRDLRRLKLGDSILAYDRDSDSLMGHLRVVKWDTDENGWCESVYLRPKLRLGHSGVKVGPMKKADETIAEIGAFKSRRSVTLCDIEAADAKYILRAAKKRCPKNEIIRWD